MNTEWLAKLDEGLREEIATAHWTRPKDSTTSNELAKVMGTNRRKASERLRALLAEGKLVRRMHQQEYVYYEPEKGEG